MKSKFSFPRYVPVYGLIGFLVAGFLAAPALASPRDKERWNQKYQLEGFLFGVKPIAFLRDNVALLPKGKALDLAMGEGRNGVFLATQGFEVTGIDISETGLNKAHQLAASREVSIETRVADLENVLLKKNTYDVVLCTYYLQRDLFPQMKAALKSGGMAVVETYNLDYLKYNPGFRKQWALKENELLEIFKDFKIIRYQTVDNGKEAFSSIIAMKP